MIDVSIIIAAWNAEKYIETTIQSALNQREVAVEVIVCDDASTDNTAAIVASIDDSRVQLVRSHTNGGPGAARNKALEYCTGKWIAVLDSDDLFTPSRLVDMLERAPVDADVLIDNLQRVTAEGKELFYSVSDLPIGKMSLSSFILSNLLFKGGNSTGYVKPLFKREFIEKNLLEYWPEIRIGEDYYFLASCLVNEANAYVIDYSGYEYLIRDGSVSRQLISEDIGKIILADFKFVDKYQLSGIERKAQTLRLRSLKAAEAFVKAVELAKRKEYMGAIKELFMQPLSIQVAINLLIIKKYFHNKIN
jgi:succinoglycan biosynthesis protein ExoO